jgi:hypothetical protein
LAAVILFTEVVGRLVGEVVDKPPVSQGAIGYECNIEFASRRDQTIVLVKGFEWGEFRLDGVYLCNYMWVSFEVTLVKGGRVRCLLEFAFRNVAAEHSERPMYLVLPSLRS